ncbi:MAG: hypothetical protein Q4G28_03830 [Neisseria sp.]|nr:hypothetical protein [Neisseria sp.]
MLLPAQKPIKITLKHLILHQPIFLKFAQGVGFGDFGGYFACVLQHRSVGKF